MIQAVDQVYQPSMIRWNINGKNTILNLNKIPKSFKLVLFILFRFYFHLFPGVCFHYFQQLQSVQTVSSREWFWEISDVSWCSKVNVSSAGARVHAADATRASLTVFNIGKSVHEGQPHKALRGRICHQHIQKRVQHNLLLESRRTHARTALKKQRPEVRRTDGKSGSALPAGGSTSALSAPCSRRRVLRKRPWAASAPPGGTGRTLQTSWLRWSRRSVRKYLGGRGGEITQFYIL